MPDSDQLHYDSVIEDISNYVHAKIDFDSEALNAAKLCLLDSLGCAYLALNYEACTKLLGPLVPELTIEKGTRIPGTDYILDPVQAAFNIGAMIRWLDYNDTWLAQEWGHPSDNFGCILGLADYISQKNVAKNKSPITMKTILEMCIKAYEIQGVLALSNSFNKVGIDHVALVKIASAAVAAKLLDLNKDQTKATISQAFVDGQALRTYRHHPNTGSRKSWAAGDACARAVRLALISSTGEMGYKTPISSKKWGLEDVLFKGEPFSLKSKLKDYVIKNILFKLAYPAEFHSQTALEIAIDLHKTIKLDLAKIKHIHIYTHEPAIRIIDKKGPLLNPASRDHCLQYIVAIGLIYGDLKADHYEETIAKNPLINILREKMIIKENRKFTSDYYDTDIRSIASSVQIEFVDGKKTELIENHFPVGHPKRRKEGIPLLKKKFIKNTTKNFTKVKQDQLMSLILKDERFEHVSIHDFMAHLWGSTT